MPGGPKKARRAPPSQNGFALLSDETVGAVLSYILDYTIKVQRCLFVDHARLSTTCKMFRAATARVQSDGILAVTGGRWTRPPRIYTSVVLADAARLRIHGVTAKAAKQHLMVPPAVLQTLDCAVVPLSRKCNAHVHRIPDVFDALSSLYPTVEAYETALETKRQMQAARRNTAKKNAALRAQRHTQVTDLLRAIGVWGKHSPDPRLMRLYLQNGSPRNLAKIEEAAREARRRQDRAAEVRQLTIDMGAAGFYCVPTDLLHPYLETGDKVTAWPPIVAGIERAKAKRERSLRVQTLIEELGIPSSDVTEETDVFIETADGWDALETKARGVRRSMDERAARERAVLDRVRALAGGGACGWMQSAAAPMILGYLRRRCPPVARFIDGDGGGGCGDAPECDDGGDAAAAAALVREQCREGGTVDDTEPSAALTNFLCEARREDLRAELYAHGLVLRSDSKFCSQYIRGTTGASLQEVVATMKLTNHLFTQGGHRHWSRNHWDLESRMRSLMQKGQAASWYDACAAVLPLATWEDDSDDDEYF
jgi:hypothetical protein